MIHKRYTTDTPAIQNKEVREVREVNLSQNPAESLLKKRLIKTLTEKTKKPRSDSNDPLQGQKERAVDFFKKRFPGCKKNVFGLMDNILMGQRSFRSTGATDLSILLELIDGIPGDIKDPVARLCDMIQRSPSYRP